MEKHPIYDDVTGEFMGYAARAQRNQYDADLRKMGENCRHPGKTYGTCLECARRLVDEGLTAIVSARVFSDALRAAAG